MHKFNFVRSGFISIKSGKIQRVGLIGYDKSSYTNFSDTTYNYDFRFDANDVDPFHDNDRDAGFPLRCLAS